MLQCAALQHRGGVLTRNRSGQFCGQKADVHPSVFLWVKKGGGTNLLQLRDKIAPPGERGMNPVNKKVTTTKISALFGVAAE